MVRQHDPVAAVIPVRGDRYPVTLGTVKPLAGSHPEEQLMYGVRQVTSPSTFPDDPMTHRFMTCAVTLAAVLSSPHALAAQGLGITAGTGYFAFTGDDVQALDAALGLEGRIWYAPSSKVSFGIGVTRLSSDVDGFTEDIATTFVFAEPRLNFVQPGGNVKPFLGARLGYARQTVEVEGTDASTSGFSFGPIGGLGIQLGSSVSLEIAGSYTFLRFGDVSVEGDSIDDTDSKGGMMSLTAGLAISLGRRE